MRRYLGVSPFDKAGRHVAATAIYNAAVAIEPNRLVRILTEPHWE